jgi:hypothetical protein
MAFTMISRFRRTARLAGAGVLVLGAIAGLVLSGASAASAGTCTAPGTCTAAGLADLGAGSLTLTAPDALSWATTLNGLAQAVVDTTTGDQSLTVDDATGSAAGWSLTVDATTFTSGADTLADTGTFSVTGSASSPTSATAPGVACTVTGQCTVPTGNTVPSYPVAVTTAVTGPTPSTIYTAAAGSGIGSVIVGSTAPIGWWITLPGNVLAGSYTSTIDFNIASGP